MSKIKLVLSLIFTSFLVLTVTIPVKSQTRSIKIGAFDGNRTSFVISNNTGGPPPGFALSRMGTIYSRISNNSNFGPSGVVPCDADFDKILSYVNDGDLVDEDGNLLVDVFFAPPTHQELSVEEAEELKQFIQSGGVLYLSGHGSNDATSAEGVEFNLLFEKLGMDDKFLDDQSPTILPVIQSAIPIESIVTNGPFGSIGTIKHGQYRKFQQDELITSIKSGNDNGGIVFEKRIGKGYLVVSTTTIFQNFVMDDPDNVEFFLNLFSLGCRDDWRSNAVVLDVPSFKQGIYPYDDDDPFWEDHIYDSGNEIELDCDDDTLGIADGTIGECGCAMTSAAMVMKYHGIDRLGIVETNPLVLDMVLKEFFDPGLGQRFHGYTGGLVRWNAISNISAANHQQNNEFPKLDLPVREDYSYERVVELIDNDIPIILKVDGGAHWVTVVGYDPDTERVIINDPAYPDPPIGKYTYLDEKYTPVVGSSMVSYTPTLSDFRYLEFVSSVDNLVITDSEGNTLANLNHAFDENYINPVLSNELPTGGMHTWTVKLPNDGEYLVKANGPFTIYTSNTEGDLATKDIEQDINEKTYRVTYLNETAGTVVNIEEVQQVEVKEVKINVEPFSIFLYKLLRIPIPVPVSIYSDANFDATLIDESTLRLGVEGTENSLYRCQHRDLDLNRDRRKDKLCWFDVRKMGIQNRTKTLKLTGKAQNIEFFGTDKIKYH